MIKKVVIIDEFGESKIGPYEHPKVLAERAAVRIETNSNVIEHVDFSQYKKTFAEVLELKKVKKEYKQIKTNFNEREALIREIVSHRTPNWGSIKVLLSKN